MNYLVEDSIVRMPKYKKGTQIHARIHDGAFKDRNTWINGKVTNITYDGGYLYDIAVKFYMGDIAMHGSKGNTVTITQDEITKVIS